MPLSLQQVLRAYLFAHADTYDAQKDFPVLPERWEDLQYPHSQILETLTHTLNEMLAIMEQAQQLANTLYGETEKDFLSQEEVNAWALVEAKRLKIQPSYYKLFSQQAAECYIVRRNGKYRESLDQD